MWQNKTLKARQHFSSSTADWAGNNLFERSGTGPVDTVLRRRSWRAFVYSVGALRRSTWRLWSAVINRMRGGGLKHSTVSCLLCAAGRFFQSLEGHYQTRQRPRCWTVEIRTLGLTRGAVFVYQREAACECVAVKSVFFRFLICLNQMIIKTWISAFIISSAHFELSELHGLEFSGYFLIVNKIWSFHKCC